MKAVVLLGVVLAQGAMAQEGEGAEPGRRGQWVIAVQDIAKAEGDLRGALERLGGFVSDTEGGEGARRIAGKVGIGSFDQFVQRVRALGEVISESTATVDPTPAFAALNARLSALEASERALLEQLAYLAPDEPLALDIQRELAGVRSARAEAIARRALLDQAVAYATVRVSLVAERPRGLFEEVRAVVREAWEAPGLAARKALAVTVGLLLPFVGVPVLVLWLVVRRARRRQRQ